jgi:hypothetical protein
MLLAFPSRKQAIAPSKLAQSLEISHTQAAFYYESKASSMFPSLFDSLYSPFMILLQQTYKYPRPPLRATNSSLTSSTSTPSLPAISARL